MLSSRQNTMVRIQRSIRCKATESEGLDGDLAFPCSLRQAQCLHQILPSRAPAFLLANILKQLLSLVNEELKVALVVLVLDGGFQVTSQVHDLNRQDGGLDLG